MLDGGTFRRGGPPLAWLSSLLRVGPRRCRRQTQYSESMAVMPAEEEIFLVSFSLSAGAVSPNFLVGKQGHWRAIMTVLGLET